METIPEELERFLRTISDSYDHFEWGRDLIERSMDLSSQELMCVNDRLRQESERQKKVIDTLKETLGTLSQKVGEDSQVFTDDDDLINLAVWVQKLLEKWYSVEYQLRESEEQFRLLAENASDLIVKYDSNGICTYISPSSIPLLGYEPDELIGKTVFEVMHPEDVHEISVALNRAVRQDTAVPFTLTARIHRRDGEYRWFETTIRVLRDPETGQVQKFHTASRDVTERKESEERLLATTSRLSALIENLEAAVLVEDDHRRIVLVNQTFCDMFSIPAPPSALIGADCSNAAEQSKSMFADPGGFVERIHQLLLRQQTVVGEVLEVADGRVFERDYIPIFVEGQYRGHLWSYRDITERKQAEEQVRKLNEDLSEANTLLRVERDREKEHVQALQQLNEMKNEFVSSVSHELRTPLASIIGFAQTVLIDDDMEPETRREFIGIIHDEGKRLAKLINELLDVARIESGRLEIDRRSMNVIPVLQRSMQPIALSAQSKQITLTADFPESDIVAPIDADRISQVVINLLDNAIKFTPPHGFVTLSACQGEDGFVNITVKDTGIGIPDESLSQLFEKFYRVRQPGVEVRGTGLGLAIARQLVEMHGGTISVKSSKAGSEFTVRLPGK